jgi:hypothetical protein
MKYVVLLICLLGCTGNIDKMIDEKLIQYSEQERYDYLYNRLCFINVIHENLNPKNGKEEVKAMTGQGVLLDDTGIVLTVRHVLEPVFESEMTTVLVGVASYDTLKMYQQKALFWVEHSEEDMGLIKIGEQPFVASPLDESDIFLASNNVFMAFFDPNIKKHFVKHANIMGHHDTYEVLDREATFGYSGSPVYDNRGRIYSIVYGFDGRTNKALILNNNKFRSGLNDLYERYYEMLSLSWEESNETE